MQTSQLIEKTRKYWQLACEYDGISVDSTVVAFSPRNPYTKIYDRYMAARLKRLRDTNIEAKYAERKFIAELTNEPVTTVAIYLER
jgi:hypothetical protein